MADYQGMPGNDGGFWNPRKVEYSRETHNLLKEMMQESKLTNFQQRHLEKQMRGGGTLPLKCNPTTSAVKKPPKPKSSPPKYLNPRNYDSRGVRKKEAIEESGAYEREKYDPIPSHMLKNSQREKERLANVMEFGKDIPPPDKRKKKLQPRVPVEEPKVDRFAELQSEIDERREFLADMEVLGQGEKYRSIIETEVSQKIREMELIDKKRSAELERLIAKQDAAKAKKS